MMHASVRIGNFGSHSRFLSFIILCRAWKTHMYKAISPRLLAVNDVGTLLPSKFECFGPSVDRKKYPFCYPLSSVMSPLLVMRTKRKFGKLQNSPVLRVL